MGEAKEDGSASCSFSLMCLEDGADLGGGLTGSADDGKLLLLQSEAEEEDEEYMDHLVSKESSFCCSLSSSASSSPAFSDFSDAGAESSPSPMPSFEDCPAHSHSKPTVFDHSPPTWRPPQPPRTLPTLHASLPLLRLPRVDSSSSSADPHRDADGAPPPRRPPCGVAPAPARSPGLLPLPPRHRHRVRRAPPPGLPAGPAPGQRAGVHARRRVRGLRRRPPLQLQHRAARGELPRRLQRPPHGAPRGPPHLGPQRHPRQGLLPLVVHHGDPRRRGPARLRGRLRLRQVPRAGLQRQPRVPRQGRLLMQQLGHPLACSMVHGIIKGQLDFRHIGVFSFTCLCCNYMLDAKTDWIVGACPVAPKCQETADCGSASRVSLEYTVMRDIIA